MVGNLRRQTDELKELFPAGLAVKIESRIGRSLRVVVKSARRQDKHGSSFANSNLRKEAAEGIASGACLSLAWLIECVYSVLGSAAEHEC